MSDAGTVLRAGLSRAREGRPYPGFRPFRRSEWPIFFGRERQVQALLGLLAAHRFICIHGPSGGGKSSLIEAGLIATLGREHARLDTAWCTSTFRPGASPMWNLARGLLRALHPDQEPSVGKVVEAYSRLIRPGGSIAETARDELKGANLLLVADQFEELFRFRTLGKQEEADRFVDLLLGVFDEQPKGIHLVVATRTDFLGDCSEVVGLAEAVNAAPYLTPALTEDELRAAIRGPADLHDGKVDDVLVERMLADSADQPDRLPILQHALMRCWDVAGRQNTPGRLGLALYESAQIGTVHNALNVHADEVTDSPELNGLGRDVERAFKALSDLDSQGRAIRRPLPWKQLLAETGCEPERLERVVNRFRTEGTGFLGRPAPDERVLKPDTVVDVAHEALIRRWQRLNRPAKAATAGGPRLREGWLWEQAADGNLYRALLIDANSVGEIVGPLDERLAWWGRQPRTADWARRMSGNREATDQEAKDEIERIEALFQRSAKALARADARQRWTRMLQWTLGFLLVVGLVGGIWAWQKIQANDRIQQLAEQTQTDLTKQRDQDRQRFIVESARLTREIEQLKAIPGPTAQITAVGAPAPSADQAREVTATARQVAQPIAATPAAVAAAQNCKGAIWIGSEGAINLRSVGPDAARAVTVGDIKANTSFVSTKNVRLRQGLPRDGYVQQDAIGIVPEGARIVAEGAPVPYERPTGLQYWLDVGVSGQICSLVYFQFAGGTAESAANLKKALEKQGYLVPGQEQLSSAQGTAEVRYYHVEDRGSAEQLAKDAAADAKALGLANNRQITVADYTNWPRQKPTRGTLELWLDLSAR